MLGFLAGTHRVQRIPRNGGGRRHTSTATIAVLDATVATDIVLDPDDIVATTYRGSGPGGQHRNVTDSAVRLHHLPSGIVVCSEGERSQYMNRQTAETELRARLTATAETEAAAGRNADRRTQVRSERSAKMFTHNEQRDEVTGMGRRWRWKDFYRGRFD